MLLFCFGDYHILDTEMNAHRSTFRIPRTNKLLNPIERLICDDINPRTYKVLKRRFTLRGWTLYLVFQRVLLVELSFHFHHQSVLCRPPTETIRHFHDQRLHFEPPSLETSENVINWIRWKSWWKYPICLLIGAYLEHPPPPGKQKRWKSVEPPVNNEGRTWLARNS